jgi:hypothetical protein
MDLDLVRTVISGNTAISDPANPYDGLGGGMYIDGGNTTRLDTASRVTGNTASDTGGGIYNFPNTTNTIILANNANVSGNTPNNCSGKVVPLCSG